jgi:hypothetical protein
MHGDLVFAVIAGGVEGEAAVSAERVGGCVAVESGFGSGEDVKHFGQAKACTWLGSSAYGDGDFIARTAEVS